MHMVATLIARLKSEEVEETLSMKHSISGSSSASEMIGMAIQCGLLVIHSALHSLWVLCRHVYCSTVRLMCQASLVLI